MDTDAGIYVDLVIDNTYSLKFFVITTIFIFTGCSHCLESSFTLCYLTNFFQNPSFKTLGKPDHPCFSWPSKTESFILSYELLLNLVLTSIISWDTMHSVYVFLCLPKARLSIVEFMSWEMSRRKGQLWSFLKASVLNKSPLNNRVLRVSLSPWGGS